MNIDETTARAKSLEAEIACANAVTRIKLQPKLQKFMLGMQADGLHVPRRLKRLNAELIDETIEARFDNMPV